ncbi:hypothetical protein V8C34DRAFT_284271 [Trichoderma compactum]
MLRGKNCLFIYIHVLQCAQGQIRFVDSGYAKWHISAPTPWENDLRPFRNAGIGSQFLAKGPRQLRGSCGQRSYILVHADIYLSRDPVGKSRLVYAISLPSPTGTGQSDDSCLYMPLSSLPP